MKTLYLLRHAKSSREDPTLGDFDRPLNERGSKAGPALLAYFRKAKIRPGLVLCSAARRTMETLSLLTPGLKGVPALIEEELYLAGPNKLLKRLRMIEDTVPSVLLIGHNPGIERLAELLTGGGNKAALARLLEKFPTGALATLQADDSLPWSKLDATSMRLMDFVTPKQLAAAA